MKRSIIFFLLVCIAIPSIACDICGSGGGGGYMGILPGFRKHFISLRYSQNSLTTHLGADGSSTYLTTRETFRIAELWGAASIGSRTRIAAFVPVNYLERNSSEGKFTDHGFGDITIIGFYNLFNKQKKLHAGQSLEQSLWIGAGVKLPTGKYNPEEKNVAEGSQNTFQLGTGSTDFLLHTIYDIRLQNTGINANVNYKLTTTNKYDYKYGDKLTINLLAYHKINAGKSSVITVNSGILYERAAKDQTAAHTALWQSGGHSVMGTAGLEISLGKIGLGVNYQTPLSQRLGEEKIRANDRGMAYISFSL